MNPFVVPFGALSVLVLSSVTLSILSLFHARAAARSAERRAEAVRQQCEASLEAIGDSLTSLSVRVREVQQQPGPALAPAVARPGLNLGKRSQALRMHRHGDSSEQIARSLEVPAQEIELLLKVHRLVIKNL